MPRMDPLIETLLGEEGTELRLETGAPVRLSLKAGTVSPVKKVLGTVQIRAFVAELTSGDVADRVRAGIAGVTFPYAHPKGTVLVEVQPDGDRVVVRLVPEAPKRKPAPPPAAPPPKRKTLPPEPVPAPAPTPPPAVQQLAPATEVLVLPSSSPPLDVARTSPAAKAIDALLEGMLDAKASDLHLSTDYAPCYRIDGDVAPVDGARPIGLETLAAMIYSLMPQRNRLEFERRNDSDFAYETPRSRFRVNVFRDRVGIGAVIRQIPNKIRTVEELGLSKAIVDLCSLPKGLVLVTGPTGSGKSTTLAAMVDHVNRTRNDHIITIEDPVEFVHPHKKCLVHQREVQVHTESFKSALRAALREDPDVVLVGELRDLETVAIAIETAETGHLVFGTLHTNTAPSTVDRIIDQFPADRQAQIRVMLSETLRAVITQTLVKKRGGGRLAVHEILIVNPAIANLIREAKTFQIPSMMQTGKQLGMVTQTDALFELVRSGKVDASEAMAKAAAKADLRGMLEKLGA